MRHSEAGPRWNFLLVVVLLPSRRIPIVRGSSSPRARRALTAVETTDTSRNGRRSRSSLRAAAGFPGRCRLLAVLKALTPAARPSTLSLRRLGPRVTFARVLLVDTGRILHVYTMFDLDKTGKV